MGVSAVIEDGKLVTTASQDSVSKSADKTSVNKDNFLQLLVAQMKYQDPLEPTDNTTWVTQYAQFTQVEEIQNMASNMSLSRASALVGQTVIMEVEDSQGNTTQIQGNVDYVSYENGKAYLSINGGLYSMDDLSLVVDAVYLSNLKAATEFVEALEKLPSLEALAPSDKEAVNSVKSLYDELNEKSLGMVEEKYHTTLTQYVARMSALSSSDTEG